MPDFLAKAQSLFEYSQTLRRDFHMHPELGFQEYRTAGIVARELNNLGLEVSTGIGKTGVVALIEGGKPGPVVLIRFDMDALPIQEATGAAYASTNPGIMHACGHDAHMAIGLTVARLLNEHKDELSGTAKLVFQPAEEGLGGAQAMVADGVLESPRPDLSLALHVWNDFEYGWVSVTDGPAMAAAGSFEIKITGKGAHGGIPHEGHDPIVAGAQIVNALQSIVSRNVDPTDTAVLSVTQFQAGDAFNVIPPEAVLKGTYRMFREETRKMIEDRLQTITMGIAQSMNCAAEISLQEYTPAVVNHHAIASKVQSVMKRVHSEDKLDTTYRTMGSEDMSFMMDDIPGCYFFVGGANKEKGLDAAHHNPMFDIDERVLPQAAGLMASVAAEFLK